ncbi:MAG: hypothetical protein JXQ72_16945 [Anaerolineae bacterium]|nr:hypothetical protein [Anaerolineae bacterium]
MTFVLTRLPDEPIIVARLQLPLDESLDELPVITAQIAEMADQVAGQLYVIWNLNGQAIQFSDILLAISENQDAPPGSLTDQRVRTLVVNTHPMLETALRKLWQALGVEVLGFATLDDALAAARGEIGAQT